MKGFVVNYLRQFLAECDQAEADLQFKAEALLLKVRQREVLGQCESIEKCYGLEFKAEAIR